MKLEPYPYHDEANDWLRAGGWLSRRSDETWRDCFADDWQWFDVPGWYQATTIVFTGPELRQHIEMIEAWPQEI